jgi:hypothetical protein
MVQIFQWVYITNGALAGDYDLWKGIDYIYNDSEYYKMFLEYATDIRYDRFTGITGLNPLINQTVQNAVRGNASVGSLLESTRTQIQAILDTCN